MSQLSRPTAMVMLASEQLWPNIHGLVHWHDHVPGSRLTDVCIYHTDDEQRSTGPARRLAGFCRQRYPQLNIHLPQHAGGIGPEDVAATLADWRKELPSRAWVINATGGLKLMFAGVLQYAGTEDVEVVYRERSGEWFRLTAGDGIYTSSELDVPQAETDGISVMDLIAAQWEVSTHSSWTARAPQSFDVGRLTHCLIRHDWDWAKAFRELGYPVLKRGFLFEQYVAAVLLELGVTNLQTNLELVSREPTSPGSQDSVRQPLQEIDMVANFGGRLLIFDCKLRSRADEDAGREERITSQIRQAEATRRPLGGLAARMVLIRPNRRFSTSERLLAEAFRLDVLDREASGDLISRLAQIVGVRSLPHSLQLAESAIQDYLRGTGTAAAFCQQNYVPRRSEDPHGDPRAVLDVDQWLETHKSDLKQDWVAYRLGGRVVVRAANPLNLDQDQIRDRVNGILGDHGGVPEDEQIHRNVLRKNCRFEIKPKKGRRKHIEEALAKFLGRSLLSE